MRVAGLLILGAVFFSSTAGAEPAYSRAAKRAIAREIPAAQRITLKSFRVWRPSAEDRSKRPKALAELRHATFTIETPRHVLKGQADLKLRNNGSTILQGMTITSAGAR